MGDRVRIAEALLEGRAGRNLQHFLARDAVHDDEALDEQGVLLGLRADAEGVEHGERVGRDLQADADFAEAARLLEHDDVEAAPRQAERAAEPADAAAGNGDTAYRRDVMSDSA